MVKIMRAVRVRITWMEGTSRFDAQGNIYQAICGNCKLNQPPPSPIGTLVTSGAWATNKPCAGLQPDDG